MEGSLAIAVLAGAMFLYVPGTLLLRAARVEGIASLVCAPIVSISVYMILCILYKSVGLYTSWLSLFVPVLLASITACVIGFLAGRNTTIRIGPLSSGGERASLGARIQSSDWAMLGIYAVVGLIVCGVIFSVFLTSPDSFAQEYDNVFHLNLTYSFVDSGNWSPFQADPYRATADVSTDPLPGSGYYPTAWSCMTALVVSALGVAVPLAANAINFLFIGVVLPASMFFLMRAIFREKPGVMLWGSLCVLGFSAFPWTLLFFGPLYPNVASFSVLPLLTSCFIGIFLDGLPKRSRVVAGVLFFIGMVCCVFLQPNAVFTAGVFLAPFCIFQATRLADILPIRADHRRFAQICFALLTFALIVVIWTVFNNASFLQSVVSHSWPALVTRPQAFMDVLTLGFRADGFQLLLVVLVATGLLYTLFKRRYAWLSCSFVLAGLMYAVSVSSDGPFQHFIVGFWYTDSCRVAAMAGLFAIPLASLGLWAVAKGCTKGLEKLLPRVDYRWIATLSALVVSVVFLGGNYGTAFASLDRDPQTNALGSSISELRTASRGGDPAVYDKEEQAFVHEVMRTVPAKALILNVPDDGSAFAYGVDGLRVYYRHLREYGEGNETRESRLIRTGLSRIDSNDAVRAAVEKLGAEYLLILDMKDAPGERRYLFTYEDGEKWRGVESVRDDTPGFEVVLSRDDMRLYRIVAQ